MWELILTGVQAGHAQNAGKLPGSEMRVCSAASADGALGSGGGGAPLDASG